MKTCHQCGAQCADTATSCLSCGAPLAQEQTTTINFNNQQPYGQPMGQQPYGQPMGQQPYGQPYGQSYGQQPYGMDTGGIIQRNIGTAILLSIVTCGIYGIYWMIKLNDEINYLSGNHMATTGGMVILLTLVTCGIYGWYWAWKMGERVDQMKGMPGSTPILFIILQLCGLGIVNYCIMQDAINRCV